MQIGNEWFVSLNYIGIASGVSSDTLKDTAHNQLLLKCKFSRKEIGINISHDSSKLFTTIPRTCSVVMGSAYLARYDVLDFHVESFSWHNHLQEQAWEKQKKEHVALDEKYML